MDGGIVAGEEPTITHAGRKPVTPQTIQLMPPSQIYVSSVSISRTLGTIRGYRKTHHRLVRSQELANDSPRIILIRHPGRLRVRRAANKLVLNRQINRILTQRTLRTSDITLHPTRNDINNAHAKRRQLDAQRGRIGVQRGFGGIVDGAEDVGCHGGDAADLHDGAAGGEQERREGLAERHDAEDIGFECFAHLGGLDFQSGDGVVAAGVVDEVVELALGAGGNFLDEGGDAVGGGDFEGEGFNSERGQVGDGGAVAGGGEDAEAGRVEFTRDGVANSSRCASGDESGFASVCHV